MQSEGITCTTRAPCAHRVTCWNKLWGKVMSWFLGYSMLTYCPHSEAEVTVAGTLSPFDRVQVTVMPAESHERDMGETARRHSAVVQWRYLLQLENTRTSLSNTWIGLRNHPNTCTARASRIVLPRRGLCLVGGGGGVRAGS